MRSLKIGSILILVLFSLGLTDAQGKSLKKASFMPHWLPHAQFAGFYVAYEKGLYKKHGIDLKIIPGGPNRSTTAYLKEGKVDFVTLWLSSGIKMRAEELKVVNISQIVQRSGFMLIAKKTSGINSIIDIHNKKVGLWAAPFDLRPKALFRKYDIKVTVVPQSVSLSLFLRDGVHVASAMYYNEYHTLLNSGLDPQEMTPFFFRDYDLDFPEDGIYTLEDRLTSDPDLCRSFVNASQEGWRYAFANPDDAVDIVMKLLRDAHIPANRVHQKWMLERIRELTFKGDGSHPLWKLSKKGFIGTCGAMKRSGFIDRIPYYDELFKDLSP